MHAGQTTSAALMPKKLAEPSGSTLELTLTKPHALGDCGTCGVTLADQSGKRKNGVYAVVMGSTFRERTKHVVVTSATGAAAEAGLLVHDELLAFNNEPIESVQHAEGLFLSAAKGEHCLRVRRLGAAVPLVVGKVVGSTSQG